MSNKKPTHKDHMIANANYTNPKVQYHGRIRQFLTGDRFWRAKIQLVVDDADTGVKMLEEYRTNAKTACTWYSFTSSIQTLIDELVTDRNHYPDETMVKIWIGEKPKKEIKDVE